MNFFSRPDLSLIVAYDSVPNDGTPIELRAEIGSSSVLTHLRQPLWVKRVQAREYVGKPERHGGSLSVFIRCDDDQVYNVKFQESYSAPSGLHLLVNELVAAGLGHLLGLPTPEVALVEITREFLEQEANQFLKSLHKKPVSTGLHFGSQRVQGVEHITLARQYLPECSNKDCFPCFFVFDIWTNNDDRKINHCLIVRPDFDPRRFYVCSVDHGLCFGGPDWTAEIENEVGQWCGTYVPEMAALIEGEDAFESWLEELTEISEGQIDEVLGGIPGEWQIEHARLNALRNFILGQKEKVGEIIEANRSIFPNWGRSSRDERKGAAYCSWLNRPGQTPEEIELNYWMGLLRESVSEPEGVICRRACMRANCSDVIEHWIGNDDDVYVRYPLDPMASEPDPYAVGAVRQLPESEFFLSCFRSLKDALGGRNPVPRPSWLDVPALFPPDEDAEAICSHQ